VFDGTNQQAQEMAVALVNAAVEQFSDIYATIAF